MSRSFFWLIAPLWLAIAILLAGFLQIQNQLDALEATNEYQWESLRKIVDTMREMHSTKKRRLEDETDPD